MKKTVWNILGKVWALPTTLIGLTLGALYACFAPRRIGIRFAHNAVCFCNCPLWPPQAGGLTLGNVILFRGCGSPVIAEHEMQHTRQAEVLGIFYIPAHVACLLIYGTSREGMSKNPLERGPYSTPPRPW